MEFTVCTCQSVVRSVRSFVLCGQGSSLLWTPTLRPFESVQCVSPGRGGVARCVWCARSVGWRRKVGLSSLSGISKRAPLGVAYCLTKPGLALVRRQSHRSAVQCPATWLTLLQRQPWDLVTSVSFGSHVSVADTLTLLVKASVTVYRGHRRTLLPAEDLTPCPSRA